MSSSAESYWGGVNPVKVEGPSNVFAVELVVNYTATSVEIACCKTTNKYKNELDNIVESMHKEEIRQVNTE